MQFQCPHCKAILVSDGVSEGMSVACPECHAAFEVKPYIRKAKLRAVDGPMSTSGANADEDLTGTIHTKMASAIGIEKLQGFKLSDLFTEVFSKHSREEVEDYFTVGTAKSTPDITEVDTSWPKPWLFTRMMLASVILYFLMLLGWDQFGNTKLLPGLMFLGSFAIPTSVLMLFIELNVRRNISLYMVLRLTFLGGILSLLITHVLPIVPWLFTLFLTNYSEALGASVAGPMEETAKVLAMVAVASAAKYRYKLNGLLVGAAVGVGFAAFESAGYAFDVLIDSESTVEMVKNINARGLVSPFGHVVWSAIAGCALWRVIRGRPFRWSMLVDVNFIRLFLVPVILHMIWNSPLQMPYFGTQLLVGAVGWFVCLSLVQEGLHEVREEQAATRQASIEGEAK